MSSQRYRRLLTNLPSMASVVNAFESPDVQQEVYHLLVDALDDAVGDEETGRGSESSGSSTKLEETKATGGRKKGKQSEVDEALADVVEGESIHSIGADN